MAPAFAFTLTHAARTTGHALSRRLREFKHDEILIRQERVFFTNPEAAALHLIVGS